MSIIGAVVGVLVVIVGICMILNRPVLATIQSGLPDDFPPQGFAHESLEELLRVYVDSQGEVDYERWHGSDADRQKLNGYLAAVAKFSPDTTPTRFPKRSDALAYWLYAYNAYVIWSILDHWPLQSVTDVKAPIEVVKGLGFFYRQRFLFGGEAHSLYAVENQIVRKQYKDPRIHFVLNCASASCPVLRPELPTGAGLEELLRESTLDFVSNTENVQVDHERHQIRVSTIFKWYEKDFVNDLRRRGVPVDKGVVEYIASVAPDSLRRELADTEDYETVYIDYDWAINSQN